MASAWYRFEHIATVRIADPLHVVELVSMVQATCCATAGHRDHCSIMCVCRRETFHGASSQESISQIAHFKARADIVMLMRCMHAVAKYAAGLLIQFLPPRTSLQRL